MPTQCSDKPGEVRQECPTILLRLERARLDEPRKPTLTLPEWELLKAFGLGTLTAVRQRMNERAMLAAYDGAPSALSEFTTECIPASSVRERVPSRDQAQSQPRNQDTLKTRLDYDPENLRVTVQCAVTRCIREQEWAAAPRIDPERPYYAVTFDVRDGGVIQRESGAVPPNSGKPRGRGKVVREFIPQLAR